MTWHFVYLTHSLYLFFGLISLYFYCSNGTSSFTHTKLTAERVEFDWETLIANDTLVWVKCIKNRECARLNVPLNYSDPGGQLATIALIRFPSPLLYSSPSEYRGPVLFNPGGPGSSGVDFIAGPRGELFAQILGPQFDIVGFDPRGLGRSTPRVTFFDTSAERALWLPDSLIPVNATPEHLPRTWARAQIASRLAQEHDKGFLAHINTDNTARDMFRINQAYGRDTLQYWGFSYGTVLGATYAAMFPSHIERLVIDGVVDAESYFAIQGSNSLLDTDKTLQTFFDGCARAGDRCAFHAPTAEDISRNLNTLYDSVRVHPVPVYTKGAYGVVDYSRLRQTIMRSLLSPYAQFSKLASALAHLAAGDGAELFKLYRDPVFECNVKFNPRELYSNSFEGGRAIRCTDGKEVRDSLEEFERYYENMAKVSNWAELWVGMRIGCSSWPIRRDDHFTGPFAGNTSYPMLIVGNTADPVTPLWGAKKMSRGFPGSIVLTQDSPGHGSVAVPSICTQRYIRQYFQNGTLPKVDSICGVDGELFPQSSLVKDVENLSGEDRDILVAATTLAHLNVFKNDFF